MTLDDAKWRFTDDAPQGTQKDCLEEPDSTVFFRGNNTSRYVVSDHFVCNFLDKAFYTCRFWSQNLNILYSLFLQNSPQLALYWIHGSWNQRICKFCREFEFLEWSYYFPHGETLDRLVTGNFLQPLAVKPILLTNIKQTNLNIILYIICAYSKLCNLFILQAPLNGKS